MTPLPIQTLSSEFSAAPQLEPSAMAAVAAMGFRSVINNRPDFEGGDHQPTSEMVELSAKAAGLTYAYLPVAGAYQSPEEIAAFRRLLQEMPHPILAFCRSGARSTKLFIAASQPAGG